VNLKSLAAKGIAFRGMAGTDMNRGTVRRRLIPALLALLLSAGVHATFAGQARQPPKLQTAGYDRAVHLGRIRSAGVTEASGLAPSRRRPDMLWVLNDSGNQPAIYALGTNGADMGEVRLTGAMNRDWEDMASFVMEGRPRILVADVGDNNALRNDCTLYVLDEPDPPGPGGKAEAPVSTVIPFSYDDGPRDCEAVAVDVGARMVLMLSKRTSPPVLYGLPLPDGPQAGPATARRITPVPGIPRPDEYDRRINGDSARFAMQPTALDIAPDGRAALVMNYKDAYLFPRREGADWAATMASTPLRVPLPQVKGKEAACFAANGRDIYFTCEGQQAPLFVLGRSRP